MITDSIRPGRIRVFTTGGTIDKIYFDAMSRFEVGHPQIADILADVNVQVDYSVKSLFMKDSLEITDEDREVIRRHVERAVEDRILITHGTDTMVQTAAVLKGVIDKVIVLVGSLSPSRFKGSDAEFNIGFALAAVQLLPPGVYIAMNGLVFKHDEVHKNRAENRFEAND
ncbi:MAG: asparaginase domain-containing protein [Rhodothermales bacterium]|nr:asparaginase domain-containing protein [Rhodothermales bacterium]